MNRHVFQKTSPVHALHFLSSFLFITSCLTTNHAWLLLTRSFKRFFSHSQASGCTVVTEDLGPFEYWMQFITLPCESWINHVAKRQQIINITRLRGDYISRTSADQDFTKTGREAGEMAKIRLTWTISGTILLHRIMQDLTLSLTPSHRPAGEHQRGRRRR